MAVNNEGIFHDALPIKGRDERVRQMQLSQAFLAYLSNTVPIEEVNELQRKFRMLWGDYTQSQSGPENDVDRLCINEESQLPSSSCVIGKDNSLLPNPSAGAEIEVKFSEEKELSVKDEIDTVIQRLQDGDCENLTIQQMAQKEAAVLLARDHLTVSDIEQIARLFPYCEQGYSMNTEYVNQIAKIAQAEYTKNMASIQGTEENGVDEAEISLQIEPTNNMLGRYARIFASTLTYYSIGPGSFFLSIFGTTKAYEVLVTNFPAVFPFEQGVTPAITLVGGPFIWGLVVYWRKIRPERRANKEKLDNERKLDKPTAT